MTRTRPVTGGASTEAPPPAALPRVLYVAGYGRSGSTLMDMLLSAHPDACGTGELARIFDYILEGGSCTCQETYESCALWGGVLRHLADAVPGFSVERAAAVTRRVERRPGLWRSSLPGDPALVGEYTAIWRGVFGAVAAATGAAMVVDSSKSDRASGIRALALRELCGLDVRTVHQVRDPRGVMWSLLRGSNRKIEEGRPPAVRGGALRALAGWIAANATVEAMVARRGLPVVRVRYEDLVEDAPAQLRRLARPFGIDVSPLISFLEEGGALRSDHGVAGNRLRRKGVEKLRADVEWRTRLPRPARLLALAAWPLVCRYEYPPIA
jgi:hypothetical protein